MDDIFKCIFVNQTLCVWIEMSSKFVLKGLMSYNELTKHGYNKNKNGWPNILA